MNEEQIITKIRSSRKYKDVDIGVLRRLVAGTIQRYGLKRADAQSRRLLHQIWAIYYSYRNSNLMEMHTSTAERLSFLRSFYDAIFAVTGPLDSIADYACGLNPLAFAQLGYSFPRRYLAFDIDNRTVQTLQSQFLALGLQDRFSAAIGDLLAGDMVKTQASLLLKVLPVLELQQKGSARYVLEQIPSKIVIASYPIKSVSGKEKGMLAFYRQQFMKTIEGLPWTWHELLFGNELVYIIDKGVTDD